MLGFLKQLISKKPPKPTSTSASHRQGSGPIPSPDKSRFPARLTATLAAYNAWLVGGAARYCLGLTDTKPKDFDFIIPMDSLEAQKFKKRIQEPSALGRDLVDAGWSDYRYEDWVAATTMGGYRLETRAGTADIWFDDVASYVTEVPTAWDGVAIRLQNYAVLVSREFASYGENFVIDGRRTRRHLDEERFCEHLRNQGLDVTKAFLEKRSLTRENLNS